MTDVSSLNVVGGRSVLMRPKIALICSVQCPGKLILKTYDYVTLLRNQGITVISGFHSPIEQECLRILLRSSNPAIWCLARGLYKKIPTKPINYRVAVENQQLVMVSPFKIEVTKITPRTAIVRNKLVAELASHVIVSHAAPLSKVMRLCQELLAAGKPVYTFNHPANLELLAIGAKDVKELSLSE